MIPIQFRNRFDYCQKCHKVDGYKTAPALLALLDAEDMCSCHEQKVKKEDANRILGEHVAKFGLPEFLK